LGAIAARLLRPGSAARALAAAVAVAAGLVAAQLGVAGVPSLPPADTIGWIPFATGAALLVLAPLERRAAPLAFAVVAVLAGAAAYLVGKPTWSQAAATTTVLGIGVTAAGAALVAGGLDLAARRLPMWAVLFSLLAAVTGASVASLFSHTALMAMVFGGVAATLGGLAVVGLLLRALVPARA